ncbi:MAG: choice-of-anchor D domain-containing protein [Terriglobales bacterium]
MVALLTLAGCQGISAAGNQQPPPTGDLSLSGSTVEFGSVTVGQSKTVTLTATNTGAAAVTVNSAASSASQFSLTKPTLPLTVAVGQNVTLSLTFAPTAQGTVTGNLSISSNASDSAVTVALSGNGVTGAPGNVTPTQSSLSFASVQVGLSQTLSETLTNSGGSSLTISQAAPSGTGFSVNGLIPPVTLTAGQSVTFSVVFTPQSAGSASGNLAIASNASNPTLNIPLSGTGTPTGQLAVSPTSLAFGNGAVGSSANLQAALNATGASVTVSSVNMSSSEFALSGISFPTTITAGTSVPFTVTFTPQATGTASGTASFVSNAANNPAVLSFSGTGTPVSGHSVLLSWTASGSPNISGYNIYRGLAAGGPFSQINTSLIGGTTYTDNSVVDGQTYYYEATAVDSSSQESAKSTPAAQAVIPTQ